MPEYIDKSVVLDQISKQKLFYEEERKTIRGFLEEMNCVGAENGLTALEDVVSDIPTADVAPVVHGKNLTEHNPVDEFKCSHCGAIFRDVVLCKIDEDSGDESYYEFEFRFCPRCGMKVELR